MFDIYWDRDCVGCGYETADAAVEGVNMIIKRNNGKIIAVDSDGNNLWWLVRFYDINGFAEYECLSVRKNCK